MIYDRRISSTEVILEHLPEQEELSVQPQQRGPLKGNDVIKYKVGENVLMIKDVHRRQKLTTDFFQTF